jgi:uncharacterized membrane protein
MMQSENDPLWRLRHALAGLGGALLLSVPTAAFLGSWVGDQIADSYGLRVALYGALLVYVLVGAVVLFVRVAQHERRPLTIGRLLLWWVSLWLWPGLLATGRRAGSKGDERPPGAG